MRDCPILIEQLLARHFNLRSTQADIEANAETQFRIVELVSNRMRRSYHRTTPARFLSGVRFAEDAIFHC
jgi:hypothetical protein